MDTLPKPRLVELSRDFGVVVKKSATKEEQVRALVHKTRAPLSDILRALGRDELKLACRAHGLDDRGRSREELALRLLKQGNAAESRSPSSDALPYRLQPEKGDIVAVRQRQYLVTEVVTPSAQGVMTLVRLVCLDDDAQGRPLEVLWELELGARVLTPKAEGLGAISELDEPREFAAYFHALKWSGVTASDGSLFQAPFRAGIALKSYQLTPLRKALELPRANLFIADDVGVPFATMGRLARRRWGRGVGGESCRARAQPAPRGVYEPRMPGQGLGTTRVHQFAEAPLIEYRGVCAYPREARGRDRSRAADAGHEGGYPRRAFTQRHGLSTSTRPRRRMHRSVVTTQRLAT